MLLIAAMGCGSTAPSRFYTLTSLMNGDDRTDHYIVAHNSSVEVGPVTLPKYLDRPQIVTRSSPNIVQTAEFDRWAEPLKNGVLRVLVENLSHLLAKDRLSVYSWEATTPADYRVRVHVFRFDGQLGKKVVLTAGWIIDNKNNETLLENRSTVTEASVQSNYEAMVSAASRALAVLSRNIAEDVCKVIKGTPCVKR
jgi:hypothetical protein